MPLWGTKSATNLGRIHDYVVAARSDEDTGVCVCIEDELHPVEGHRDYHWESGCGKVRTPLSR